jgi:protein-S-isoprenylcysteine O-methyltransferase Ste14
MGRAGALRFLALYVPAMVAYCLSVLRPRRERMPAAVLVGSLWTLATLPVVQELNLHFKWWWFDAVGGLLRGMPVDFYLGWAVLWGIVPILAFRRTAIFLVVMVFFGLDLVLMPACFPVVGLSAHWLVGESIALGLVLLPAQLFARWTLDDAHLKGRAVLHVIAAGTVVLFLMPQVVFALRPGGGWDFFLSEPNWLRSLELQTVALLAFFGVSAVQEFAERGQGTPIPYDPPKLLVVSGLYRYISNPMQLSCTLVMVAWGFVLKSPWLAAGGLMSFLYSYGLAAWDEGEDMNGRFGKSWQAYRKNVPPWRARWAPWHAPDRSAARLYVAETCGPCSEVRRWFEARKPTALEIVAAEDHPDRDLGRITYDPMDGGSTEEGLWAVARGLEHINLSWALLGACVRLPGIAQVGQIIADASGFGPRLVSRRTAPTSGVQGTEGARCRIGPAGIEGAEGSSEALGTRSARSDPPTGRARRGPVRDGEHLCGESRSGP